jgi:peptidoglycan/LPS O-acetylase OafA/YrhL
MGESSVMRPGSGVVVEIPLVAGGAPRCEGAERRARPTNPDIQALRAVAVALVVLYHAWPAYVPGGYIGVDVFFVISGFLITRQLLDEMERAGSISLAQFWMRRARRLLPASLLVLGCSAAATFAWVPRRLWTQYFRELQASALYIQNWVLAADSVDYFNSTNKASPAQHFWTLSVEEQFYLGLPLLLLAGMAAQRKLPWIGRRSALAAVLALAAAGSVVLSLRTTLESSSVAYFSSGTRAWEFAAGALLAFRARPIPVWSAVLGWVAIASAAFVFGSDTRMPGVAAFVPVLGATAVVGAAGQRAARTPSLVERPLQFLGNISYSVYLWHWPLFVLAPIALERELGHADKLVLCAASVMLAWATTRWVENPIRYARWPRRVLGPRQVAVWSTAGMIAVVVAAELGTFAIEHDVRASFAIAARLHAEDAACFGAKATRWGEPCHNPALAGVLLPHPSLINFDAHRIDCWIDSGSKLHVCTFGPQTGHVKRLAAIGDSHMGALIPPLEAIATDQGWRIDIVSRGSCTWTTAAAGHFKGPRAKACRGWNDELQAWLLEREPYDAILVTQRSGRLPRPAPDADPRTALVRGVVEAWKTQAERGARIIAIADNPRADAITTSCVEEHLFEANERCSIPRARAFSAFDAAIDATRALPASHLIDLSERYCDAQTCFPVIGNVVVYRDDNHITATFARTLTPFLLEHLQRALE